MSKRMPVLMAVAVAAAVTLLRGPGILPDDARGAAWPEASAPTTTSERTTVPGYDRDCGTGHGCVFGQPWSDDVDVKFGHNGCDTRNDVLRDRAREFTLKPGTRECVVAAGVVEDFYTGENMQFVRGKGNRVQVDHVVPLAAAWDLGAAAWPLQKRIDFANDPANLVVASGSINASKSDRTPGEWLPAKLRVACAYVTRYENVATRYGVALTTNDQKAIEQVRARCAATTTKEARR